MRTPSSGAQASRPSRPRVLDALGRTKTLSCAAADFQLVAPGGPDALLLGLGPEPERLPELSPVLNTAGRVRFVECPELAAQYGESWRARIPAGFESAPPDQAPALARTSAVLLYRPGPRLFPDFWGPLLAEVSRALMPAPPVAQSRLVWLPGGARDLLRLELGEAFEALGFSVRLLAPQDSPRELLAQGECPALFFSVNFSGLDPLGETAHLLTAMGARMAVWCVDNPLHLLSGLKSRFWTRLPLFVTDDWFLPVLRGLGAQEVRHLPLAARAADLDGNRRAAPADLAGRILFAGRSAFPGKEGFFAGCALPPDSAGVWAEARAMLARGDNPHFGWWVERLGVERLWPGTDARRAGFCAEETGRAWRAACLNAAYADLDGGLTVHGDEGWRDLLPANADLRPPVDYYAALPDLCASAGACLNCTSPLLPHGLTQRHFDVWAWGGLLVTDATPGLALFPDELARPVTFRTPGDIAPLLRALWSSASGADGLKAAWREELKTRHTYTHRVRSVLEALGLG